MLMPCLMLLLSFLYFFWKLYLFLGDQAYAVRFIKVFRFWGATVNHVERKNLTLKTNFKKRCHTAWNRNAQWLIRNVQQEMCATWVGNGEFKSELCALLYIIYCKSIIHPQLEQNWRVKVYIYMAVCVGHMAGHLFVCLLHNSVFCLIDFMC